MPPKGTTFVQRTAWAALRYSLTVLAVPLSLGLIGVGLGGYAGDPVIEQFSLDFLLHIVMISSSVIMHECGHAFVLSRCHGITSLQIEPKILRFPITPIGVISRSEAITVALSGPVLSSIFGCLIYGLTHRLSLGVIFAAHLVFLFPCFGDGRSIVTALRHAELKG